MACACVLWTSGSVSPTRAVAQHVALRRGIDISLATPQQKHARFAPSKSRRRTLEQEGHGFIDSSRVRKLHFRRNGEVEEVLTVARYFLGKSGVENGGNLSVDFDADRTRVTLELAHVLSPDGRVEAIHAEDLLLSTVEGDRLFDDRTRMTIPYSNLERGAVALLRVRMLHRSDPNGLPWSRTYFPRQLTYASTFEMNVSWDDATVAPVWDLRVPGMVVKAGKQSARFLLSPAFVLPVDPQVDLLDNIPQLTLAARTGWNELARDIAGVVKRQMKGGQAIEAVVTSLDLGDLPLDERLARLHAFVVQHIRYLSNGRGHAGSPPEASTITLKRRYGDCKDKTTLFLDLAAAAGLEAFPVLVATGRHYAEHLGVPAIAYFDHMIACVYDIEPDRPRCVDLTATTTAPGKLPGGLSGTVRLDLRADVQKPNEPPLLPARMMLSQRSSRTVDDKGYIHERGAIAYQGWLAEGMRAALFGMSSAERKRWMSDIFESMFGEGLEPKLDIAKLQNLDTPLLFEWSFTYPIAAELAPGSSRWRRRCCSRCPRTPG